MDGLGSRPDLLVLGATNRKEVLDPALLRTGRLNHHVYVGPPDAKGREEIFRIHAKNAQQAAQEGVQLFSAGLDISQLAADSSGFVGSDIKEIVRRTVSGYAKRALKGEAGPYIETRDFQIEITLLRHERESKRQSSTGFAAILAAREENMRMRGSSGEPIPVRSEGRQASAA
jgi:SpoVK/Ycf46/Vps4 family AAA+-type ATPase